jgi:hypothetical protein
MQSYFRLPYIIPLCLTIEMDICFGVKGVIII